ncbi:MAG: cupin domain-containing protein [Candidatus Thiodiazotropha endolucinida]|nr:cupin domain-containing protein [Candidatus Thiodiazotropha taylori]MCG8121949.1 cupin domain-containing protein [Candidatus Thiodiazotropha taylori]MCW4290354.1 cupin domain-containing protein [Candidatus Thiodiazotropha endolucinida]MCW4297644.1 cupin domain-containing protein [Candidatus Thiodiazotropha endolucinida]
MQIEHWNETVEGDISEAAMCRKLEARGYNVTRYVYPPGTFFPPHQHAVDKIDGVLSGRFRMSMDGQSFILEAGDCLQVPRGVIYSAEVIGEQPVISIDAVKTGT